MNTMPTVQAKLALGGRHHSVFKDSLVQRSLLLRGTAAIKRVEAEEIDVDRITVRSARTTLSAIDDLTGGPHLITENAVKEALDLVDFTPVVDARTAPGMTLSIPSTIGAPDVSIRCAVKVHTGKDNFHLQGWSFAIMWEYTRCALTHVEFGSAEAPWDTISGSFTQPKSSSPSTAPLMRTYNTSTNSYGSYTSIAPTLPANNTFYELPSVKFVCTQSALGSGTTWNRPMQSTFEFNKNKPAVLIAYLTFSLTDTWAGTLQCIYGAWSDGFVNQQTQNYDSNVLYPAVDDGFSWVYGTAPTSIGGTDGVFSQHNKIPIEDIFYTGTPRFKGFMSNGIAVGSGTSKIFNNRVETPNVILSTASGAIAASGNTNYAVTGGQVHTAIESAVSGLVSGAPGALDTLNELAAALGNDSSFASTVTASLSAKLATADFNTKVPLGSGTSYNEQTTDDRYMRVLRTSGGVIYGISPGVKLQDLHNVSDYAAESNNLPTNVPGFLVWAGSIGINEFIQFDMFSNYPHSFTPHPVNATNAASGNFQGQQVGDILVYRGGYTDPAQKSYNYHFVQPSFAGSVITSGTVDAARLPDLSATYLTTSTAASTYLTQLNAASTYLTKSSDEITINSQTTNSYMKIGYIPQSLPFLKIMGIATESNFTSTRAALWQQDTTGSTILNAASTGFLGLAIDGTGVCMVQGSTMDFTFTSLVPNVIVSNNLQINGTVTSSSITNQINNANFPASQITSGTFDAARIPDLSSTYLTSVPNLPASQITSGTLDAARIPDLSSTYLTSVTTDAEMTNGSTNPIQSNWVFDMFQVYDQARLKQDMYCLRTDEWYGKANMQVWYGWGSIVSNPTSLTALVTSLGLDSTNFFTYNGWPGIPSGTSYHGTSVPPIINTGANGDPFKVDWQTFTDHFLVRWTFNTHIYNSGTYNFRLTSDAGARLQIRSTGSGDNQTTPTIVIDQDAAATERSTTGSIHMGRNRVFEVQVFWYEGTGGHRCKLEWQRPIDATYSVFSPHSVSPEFQYFHPDFSVTKVSTGHFSIAFGPRCLPQCNTYTILLTGETNTVGGTPGTSHVDDYSIVYLNKANTGFSVYIKTQDDGGNDGTFADCRFDFCCMSRGRTFCHGSVSTAGVPDEEGNYN